MIFSMDAHQMEEAGGEGAPRNRGMKPIRSLTSRMVLAAIRRA
jgi:hypothetical protein